MVQRPSKKVGKSLKSLKSLPLIGKSITKKVVTPGGLAKARLNCPICGILTVRRW
jgi:hypothetical protein